MAGPAISRSLQPVWVVGRFIFLELLPLVQTKSEALTAAKYLVPQFIAGFYVSVVKKE